MTDHAAASPLDMHTRMSGGAEIPLVGLGTWQLRGDSAADAVGWALEAGSRHIDTATAYNNEQEVGRALHASGVARDKVSVTTKMPAESRGRERATLDRSLSAMGLDHPVLRDIANTHGATAAQVVIRWHLQHEIVVIPKSARRERIVDNVDVGGLVLTEDEMRTIDGLGAAA
jgi:diketogulonate reductase-like aldo/keto reductase